MDYLKMLEHSYATEMDWQDNPELERLEFLAMNVFDFCTYENIVSAKLVKKALEVCSAITDRKTFDYIATEEGNLWYLIMVNMPFFKGKLSWGTSIRGAWWDIYESGNDKFSLESTGFWDESDQILKMEFDKTEWEQFLNAVVKFAKPEIDNPVYG